MLRVRLQGEDNLPRSVNPEQFVEAARRVGRMLGVVGRLVLRVRNSEAGMMAATLQRACRYHTIDFYDPMIREEAKTPPPGSIREQYAVSLAHELVHISQDMRGSDGLPEDVEEHEAMQLEEVYGPVIIEILKGES